MTPSTSRVPRRTAAAVLVLALVAALAGLVAPAAEAHNVLRSTVPAADTQVDVPPTSVTLDFNEPAIAAGTQVEVQGPDGAVVNRGSLLLSNTTVAQPISESLPAGAYRVVWRATSADGHPISGEFAFTALAASAAPVPAVTETPAETSTASPTETPTPAETASPSESSQAAPSDLDAENASGGPGDGGSSTPWVLGGVALVVVVGVLLGVVSARRRGRHGTPTG